MPNRKCPPKASTGAPQPVRHRRYDAKDCAMLGEETQCIAYLTSCRSPCPLPDDGPEAERMPPGQLTPGLLPERIPSSNCVRGWGGTNSAPARLERGVASSNRALGVEAICVATKNAASGIPKRPLTPLILDQLGTTASPVDWSGADSQPPSPLYRARGATQAKSGVARPGGCRR